MIQKNKTEVETMDKIDRLGATIYSTITQSALLIEELKETYINEDIPRGYSRSEDDLAAYRKCQQVMHLIADGIFSENGLSPSEQQSLDAILACV